MSKERVDGHKPLQLKLTEEQVFSSPDHCGFTKYGGELYGIITIDAWLSDRDSVMSDLLRREINNDLRKRLKRLGVGKKQMPGLKDEMYRLCEKRANTLNSFSVNRKEETGTIGLSNEK